MVRVRVRVVVHCGLLLYVAVNNHTLGEIVILSHCLSIMPVSVLRLIFLAICLPPSRPGSGFVVRSVLFSRGGG